VKKEQVRGTVRSKGAMRDHGSSQFCGAKVNKGLVMGSFRRGWRRRQRSEGELSVDANQIERLQESYMVAKLDEKSMRPCTIRRGEL